MYTILTFKTLLVSIIIGGIFQYMSAFYSIILSNKWNDTFLTVVSNQVIDRFDYPKIWYNKDNKVIAEPPEYRSLTQQSSSDKVRTRGMGTDIKGMTPF